jgi:hypothetical protein
LMIAERKTVSVLEVDGYITFIVLIIFRTRSSVTLCTASVTLLAVYRYRPRHTDQDTCKKLNLVSLFERGKY